MLTKSDARLLDSLAENNVAVGLSQVPILARVSGYPSPVHMQASLFAALFRESLGLSTFECAFAFGLGDPVDERVTDERVAYLIQHTAHSAAFLNRRQMKGVTKYVENWSPESETFWCEMLAERCTDYLAPFKTGNQDLVRAEVMKQVGAALALAGFPLPNPDALAAVSERIKDTAVDRLNSAVSLLMRFSS